MPTGPRPRPPVRSIRLVFGGSFLDAVWFNVMWLYATGTGEITHSNVEDLANDCGTQYASNLMPSLSEASALESIAATLYGPDDELVEAFVATGVPGSDASNSLTAQVAACITWKLGVSYRGGHPRSYLCGIGEAATSSATTWNTTWKNTLAGGANSFHSGVEGLGPYGGIETVEHGVVSFVVDNAWRSPPVFRRILSAVVDSRIDTQRRRLGRDRAA